MAKVMYTAAMSLDGFIAGAGGDMSWLAEHTGPNPVVDELIAQTGAILAGARTFGGDDPHKGTESEGKVFGGGWEGPQFVLTHNPPANPVPGVTFVRDLATALSAAKAAAGEKYVNVLGATTGRSCLEAGALDEVVVSVVPVLLGDGVRLFEHPGGMNVKLERIGLSHGPQVTNIRLRVLG